MPGTAVGAPILPCPDLLPGAVGKIRMRCRLPDNVTVINGRGHIPALSLLLFHLQELLSVPLPAPKQSSRADGKGARITTIETSGGKSKYQRVFSCKCSFWCVQPCLCSKLCPKHQTFYNPAGSLGVQCGKLTGVSNDLLSQKFCVSQYLQKTEVSPISAGHFSSFLPRIPSDIIIMVIMKLLINSRYALLNLFS